MIRRRHLGPIAALATFLALASGGVAAAAWIASASVSGTASSATVGTTLVQAGSLATTYRYAGNTSGTVTGTLAIANTGRAPLTYTLATQTAGSATLAQKTTLLLWTGTCGATPPSTGVTTTTLSNTAPALPAAARTLAPGAAVTVCVATRITGPDATSSNAALQGQSVTASFSVTGTVGSSWTANAATAAITQNVYRVASAGAVTCAPSWNREVVLSWPAPANRVAGSPVSYRVFDTATAADVATVTVDGTSASVTLDAYDLPRNGTYSLAVEAKDTVSGTTAPATAPVSVTRSTSWIFFPGLSCS